MFPTFPSAVLRCAAAALYFALGAAQAAPPEVPDTLAQRVMACTVCHGKEGRATPEGYFPRIAGKPAGYLYNQLLNFRDGRRHYAAMTYLLEHLSDDYLREIANHFADLDLPYAPPAEAAPRGEAAARGEALVLHGDKARELPACVQCHGTTLTGVAPFVPGLLGLPRDYLNGQLGAWRTGHRRAAAPDCMADIAKKLAPEDVSAITAWLASRPVPANAKPAAAAPGPWPMDCGGVTP